MRLGAVRTGDIVEVDVRGVRFLAHVEGTEVGALLIKPLCRGVSYRRATARQVLGHWRRSRSGRSHPV